MKKLTVLTLMVFVALACFAVPETEPNNSWDATGVILVQNGTHNGNVSPTNDHDYWKFESAQGDQIEVNTCSGTNFDTK
ncbi:MAG: hypothetical protein K8S56_04680, partial [Candidatus Cloacimonetes bacterium]|nr:hypothetical protein [Candidatus Cloacimonadota bacterium]